MYNRELQSELLRLGNIFPVVSVVGPRQSGKTTLCKLSYPNYDYVNLEDSQTWAQAMEDMRMFLTTTSQGMIIDEAQRLPELFSMIQVLVDEDKSRKFILTGSSNFALLPKIRQSLAGRTAVLTLLPFNIKELGTNLPSSIDSLLLNGFYPAVWGDRQPAQDVYRAYYNTYLQRDVSDLITLRNIKQFQRFLLLVAARVGSEFNAQSIGNDVGVSVPTIQEWMNVLETSYIAFRKYPYYKNIGKRLAKMPKVYFYDTGLACHILGIENEQQLNIHPCRGGLFENLVMVEFLKQTFNAGKDDHLYFYKDKTHEVDIVIENGLALSAYEVKIADTDNTAFYKSLRYFQQLYGDDVVSTQVIYSGTQERLSAFNGLRNYLSFFSNDKHSQQLTKE